MKPLPLLIIILPVTLLASLLRALLPLAAVALWACPTPSPAEPRPASLEKDDGQGSHAGAHRSIAPAGTQIQAPQQSEGDGPPPAVGLRPVRFVQSLVPCAPRLVHPDERTRARSLTARYRVLRSGQAHASAP